MGDQHPPGLAEALIAQLEIQAHIVDGNATAGRQGRCLQGEAEQRWHRRHHLVAEGFRQVSTTGMPACGQHQAAPMQRLEAAALEHKPPLGVNAHLLDHGLRAQLDTRRPCRPLQALNHGLRTVLLREHPSIGFLHEREPMLVKPGDRIAAGEATEGPRRGRLPRG